MEKKLNILKGILLLVLTLLLAMGTVGCNEEHEQAGSETTDAKGTTETPTDDSAEGPGDNAALWLVENGVPVNVSIPARASTEAETCAEYIARILTNRSDGTVSVRTVTEKNYDKDAVEIVVGNVPYPEVEAVKGTIPFGSWGVVASGNKLVVYAPDDEGYAYAQSHVVKLIRAQAKGAVTVSATYDYTEVHNAALAFLGVVQDLMPDDYYITGAEGTTVGAVYKDRDTADFTAYCLALEKQGYRRYTDNEISSGNMVNKFATYFDDTYIINVMYSAQLERLTAVGDLRTSTALPGLSSDNRYESQNVTPTITQLGLWGHEVTDEAAGTRWDDYINGLSHVVHLEDDSFIIIDGGNYRQIDCQRIYETMKKQAKDPTNLRVAAWIFTHAHGDHTGAFGFWNYKDVAVERFIFHFPSSEVMGGGDSVTVTSKIRGTYPNAKLTIAHPGQKFYIRNAEIEIYSTLDLLLPTTISDFNDTSIVFSLKIGGKKNLYLGDASATVYNPLINIYGASLESDAVQVAHHGFYGSWNLYATIKATYYWIDSGSELQWSAQGYNPLCNQNGNNYFCEAVTGEAKIKAKDGKTIWFAADHVWVVTFEEGKEPSEQYYENIQEYLQKDISSDA